MTAPTVESYSFGSIKIDGTVYKQDVILFPDRVAGSWRRASGHSLIPEDLPRIMDNLPDLLIIGTGKSGRMKIPDSTKSVFEAAGIEFFAASTDRAIQMYNEKKDTTNVIAALHLTC